MKISNKKKAEGDDAEKDRKKSARSVEMATMLWDMPPEQRHNRTVVESALKAAASCKRRHQQDAVVRTWIWTPPALRQDRALALLACSLSGACLQDTPADLRKDRAIVMAAAAADVSDSEDDLLRPCAFAHASEQLRRERDLVLAALDANGGALGYVASDCLRGDAEVVAAAGASAGEGAEAARRRS